MGKKITNKKRKRKWVRMKQNGSGIEGKGKKRLKKGIGWSWEG